MENNYNENIFSDYILIKIISEKYKISKKHIYPEMTKFNRKGGTMIVVKEEEISFKENFDKFIPKLTNELSIPNSTDWTVKGFIDCNKNIYSISTDTKVVSKIIELMIFPKFLEFANQNNYELKLSPHQNYYPDITFIDKNTQEKYAVDLKSTYRKTESTVNGMTLGAFTGYFRNRDSKKNTLYKYNEYKEHFVFGIIYSRTDISKIEEYLATLEIKLTATQKDCLISYINESTDEKWEEVIKIFNKKIKLNAVNRREIHSYFINETKTYNLTNFTEIQSVVKNFDFFIQEKWKIAIDRPGSGNTKNIGSESNINNLKSGNGLFVREFKDKAKNAFDKYWMTYETKNMAKEAGRLEPFFTNITSYKKWVESLKI